ISNAASRDASRGECSGCFTTGWQATATRSDGGIRRTGRAVTLSHVFMQSAHARGASSARRDVPAVTSFDNSAGWLRRPIRLVEDYMSARERSRLRRCTAESTYTEGLLF